MVGLESTVGTLIADGTPLLIDRSMVQAVGKNPDRRVQFVSRVKDRYSDSDK